MRTLIAIAFAAFAAAAPARANFAPIDTTIFVDAAQKSDKEEEAYDAATELLDEHQWRAAVAAFDRVAKMRMEHADAAMYWQAYASNKMAMRADALQKLVDLRKLYPKSRWIEDGDALEVEIRGSMGEHVRPEEVPDDDLKIMAISGLMNSDPDRALPVLQGILQSNKPEKLKERALFVIAQSNSPQARQILVKAAENGADRALQANAIKYIGLFGGEANRKLLMEVYNSTKDLPVRRSILQSFMLSGDRARLLALAKSEPNEELRGDAVSQLGLSGARDELADLYAREQSIAIRKKILSAMFLGGGGEKLAEVARTEANLDLKKTAIRNLGLLGGSKSGTELVSIYDTDTRPEIRREVINGLFLQNNAAALVSIARREKDPSLKREIVTKLGLMHSKEATDYLIETLKE